MTFLWSTFPSFPNFFVLLLAKFVFVSPTVRPQSIFPEMWALVVETFKYGQLKRCRNFEIGDLKSVRVDHYGEDGWQGEYVKLFTDSGPDYYCPITKFLDNSDHENLSCKRLDTDEK